MLFNLAGVTIVLVLVIIVLAIIIVVRLFRPKDDKIGDVMREEFRASREENAKQARGLREEVSAAQAQANQVLVGTLSTMGEEQQKLLSQLSQATDARLDAVRKTTEERLLVNEEAQDRRGSDIRRTLNEGLSEQRKYLAEVVTALGNLEKGHKQEQEKARESLDQKFRMIQESNEKKLEEMRQTVDEKLHNTLEKRLGESFKLVSDRLEAVQRGLGEMQTLATGVGDLKRVLTNVRERGTWGEYQLEAILAQILTPEQYEKNVATKKGSEHVEYAIKLPGKGDLSDHPVWLPIDSKFPKEDYERLLEALDRADVDAIKAATKSLIAAVSKSAKDIHDKYLDPPGTTDFAIMFLPTEGLYAEILRQPGLHDELQQKYRVIATGPTTLSALLNSLRIGFQTLAIEQQAHEVWNVLGAVKTEFGKFGGVLDKVKKQLSTASDTIEETAKRTRAMERKLRQVEALPAAEAQNVLEIPDTLADTETTKRLEEPAGNSEEES